jgi:hypothetical protein
MFVGVNINSEKDIKLLITDGRRLYALYIL